MRSGKKTTAVLAGVLVGLLSTVVIGSWQRSRPNVLMIVVDSLRGDTLSDSVGAAQTPNLRSLSSEGVLYANAFSHSPSSLPAHVALASGRLPHQSGVYSSGQAVDASVPLLAEWLGENGYETLGVLSNDSLRPARRGEGLDRGFREIKFGKRSPERADWVVQRACELLDGIDTTQSFFLLAHFAGPAQPSTEGSPLRQAEIVLDDRSLALVTTSEPTRWKQSASLTPGEHVLRVRATAGEGETQTAAVAAPFPDGATGHHSVQVTVA